jgi:hypothetical protein
MHSHSSGLRVTSFSKSKLQIIHLSDLLWNAIQWVGWAISTHTDQPHHTESGNYVKFPGFSYINQSYNEATTKGPKFHRKRIFNNKNLDFIRLPAVTASYSAISQNIYTMHMNEFGSSCR